MNIIDLMSQDLHLDPEYLCNIARNASWYYKTYSIPKKTGGTRIISQPSPELKTMQYWIAETVLSSFPVSDSVYAYRKRRSIKMHANAHRNAQYFLHVDISHFFPSIHSAHLLPFISNSSFFDDHGIDKPSSFQQIKSICFKWDCLCIGAVSSPAISNIILYPFDKTMTDYCKSRKYTYTRYADDIYISSSSYISTDVLMFVKEELKKQGFSTNSKKTGFFSSKYQKRVTGLILTTDGKVSVGTKRKREIKKMLYEKLVKGTGNSKQILGHLAFLRDVEPDMYNSLIIKYSSYCDEDLFVALRR